MSSREELRIFVEKVLRLKSEGLTYGEIAERLSVPRRTVIARVIRHRNISSTGEQVAEREVEP